MKLSSSKWILSCIFISLILVNAQPTSNVRKRQDASAQESDIAQYHHQPTTITRTSTSTAKSTSTPTSGGSGTSSGQNNGSGGNNSEPYIIPAYTSPWFVAVYGTESGISPIMASLGAILIAIGLFLCGMGFRMFRIMLCVMGLLTVGLMTWIALANLRPESGYSMDSITMIVVPVGVGVVGAVAYYFLWNIALYLVSAFGGFIFAVFILSWRSDLVIVSLIGRPCFLGGMALAAGVVTFFALRPMLFFATSFVGSYTVFFGIDCLARTGFIAGPESMLNRNPNHRVEYSVGKFVYVLLAMIILLFLISMAWQMIYNAAHHLGMHIVAAVEGKPAHEEAREEGEHPGPPSTPPPS